MSPRGRTAKLAVLLAVVATIATAQVTVTGFNGFAPGSTTVPGIFWSGDENTGFSEIGDGVTGWLSNGTLIGVFSSNLGMRQAALLSWAASTNPNAAAVLSLGSTSAAGGLRILSGAIPTQSGTTCGTGPTITGNNTLGSVALGTAPGLPCTIVFSGAGWSAAPHCMLNPLVLTTGTTTVRATGISTTQFVITSTAALVAADKVEWLCASE